jgi:hypothetical protein
MTEKNEQPVEREDAQAGTDDTVKRRALMLKLAAGAFSAPVVLTSLTRKAAAGSVSG